MHDKAIALTAATLAAATLPACTTSTVYETVKAAGKQQGQQQAPTERDKCESRVSKDDYDTYEKKRSAQ